MLRLNRKKIYYRSKQPGKDLTCKREILNLQTLHPAYGHRRIAIALKYNHKKASRLMLKYGIKPLRRKVHRKYIQYESKEISYTNLLKNSRLNRPCQAYCSDFTYLKFQDKKYYLATVEDIFTREIVAANVGNRHNSDLILKTLIEAVKKGIPQIFHTDQGSEFMSEDVTTYLKDKGIRISVSDKGSPWQNGYKESFYGKFKVENGDLNRFETLGEWIEEIYSYIKYYNSYRIHTSLKMPPQMFKQKYLDSVS